jgi:hypothetical protein
MLCIVSLISLIFTSLATVIKQRLVSNHRTCKQAELVSLIHRGHDFCALSHATLHLHQRYIRI